MANELTQLNAAAQLPPDLVLLKMENESIMSVARAVPREPMKIVRQLQELIDAYPAAADEAIYSKPVGTVIEVTCKSCGVKYEVSKLDTDTKCPGCDSAEVKSTRKVKKFAEGLSIRAAESIRSIYGYTRLATTTEILEDGKARLTGVLVDYAAGNVTSDERIVSPMYRSRGGKMERVAEDRFLNVVVKAEKSKLRRDVILDNTPNIVKAMFRDACEKKMSALVAPEIIEQKIIPAFAAYGVTGDHLDKIIGRPHALGWKEEDRLALRKILNALKNEETTVRELLDGLETKAENGAAPKTATGATIDDLTKPKQEVPKEPPPQKPPDAPADEGEAIPVQEAGPDPEQQAAEQAGLLAEYLGKVENAQSAGELSALAAHAKGNKGLTETSLLTIQTAVAKRQQAIGATALPPRRGRPPKGAGMFPDPNAG